MMVQQEDYTKYAVLAQLRTDVQNPQEMAALWGDIERQCEEIGVTVEHSYAALGEFDFLLILDAPSRDLMLQSSLILARHGMALQTLGLLPTEQFADIVSDL